jgi:hypothetical protein
MQQPNAGSMQTSYPGTPPKPLLQKYYSIVYRWVAIQVKKYHLKTLSARRVTHLLGCFLGPKSTQVLL